MGNGKPDLLLAFYGDDFTGSTDALEFLCRAGARAALFLAPPTPAQLARFPGLRAVGVAGRTRALGPAAITAELRPALAALRALGAPHVHYKVCSTFDSSPRVGSIGRAIDVAAEIFPARFVPLLVGAPALGRYCVFGNLFARMGIGSAGVIHRLDRHPAMSRHPVTPARESDLRRHLAPQTRKRIGLFDILQFARSAEEQRAALERIAADGAGVVLFDVLESRQLEPIGRLLDAEARRAAPLFSVGSSGVEMALGAVWAAEGRLTPVRDWPDPGPAGPLLVASGSCSPVTEQQIAWAVGHGFAEVALEAAALGAARGRAVREAAAVAAAAGHLRAGRSVIVHTSRGGVNRRLAALRGRAAELVGTALGRVVRGAVEQARPRRVVIAGGDTSSHAVRTLGLEALEMIAPLAPGAPLCRARAPGSPLDGLEVNFKGGQVGAEDYFGAVARGSV
ncbi:MAG TPA: four-carbon acid sugar kinase family protein [Opitutaceae bacterium]|nr:four-carbon acid sugar kinase family protein [Opitutaceae bacterium]